MLYLKNWNIEEQTGYKPITSFYLDFSIAEKFGIAGIEDTYKRGLQDAVNMGYKALTEFVMVLNWKIWEHYQANEPLARVYDSLWKEADEYAMEHLKGKELSYYYKTTD